MDAGGRGLPREPGQILNVAKFLSPFFLACIVYFHLWIPEDAPSPLGALVKCLPVLSLAASLWARAPSGCYTTLLQGALLFSAVGDICLIWREAFLHGMAAFAVAHLLYLAAFGFSPLRLTTLLPIALVSSLYYSYLLPHLPPDMTLPVAVYAFLLAAVLWRGLVKGGSARLGGLLFIISDAVLAWDTFAQPLPYSRLVVMTTYYAAQVYFAVSAFRIPRHKTS